MDDFERRDACSNLASFLHLLPFSVCFPPSYLRLKEKKSFYYSFFSSSSPPALLPPLSPSLHPFSPVWLPMWNTNGSWQWKVSSTLPGLGTEGSGLLDSQQPPSFPWTKILTFPRENVQVNNLPSFPSQMIFLLFPLAPTEGALGLKKKSFGFFVWFLERAVGKGREKHQMRCLWVSHFF